MTTELPDSEVLSSFIVKQLAPEKHGVSEADLLTSIQEIEIETQIYGASFLKLHLLDPDWDITRSGLFKVAEDGLLNEVKVEFPEGTGFQWILAACEGSTELGANLVPVFEDSIVANMRKVWGHRTFPPGLTTRAQVIRTLVGEVNQKLKLNPPIKFVSPGVNRIEPIAEATKTKAGTLKAEQEASKERGIHAGAGLKIKGLAPSPAQRAILNEALRIANELNAGTLATEALIEACITENTVSNSGEGLLQFIPSTAASLKLTKGNVKEEVTAFLTKAYSAGAAPGGAIDDAQKHPNSPAYEIAQHAQGSGAGAASNGAANYGPFHLEAQEIIHAYGGVRVGGTKGKEESGSDIGQLSRGTPENPDEDSWDCAQRLARDVGWFFFTDGRNTVFYMDGPDLIAQRPVLYVDGSDHEGHPQPPANWRITREDKAGQKVEELGALIRPLSWNYDNTAFLYRSTHKVKGRIQRRSKPSKPQTPAEVRASILCGISEYRAGNVFVFQNLGPIGENSGRWIVGDSTRECLKYPYTKFLCAPATEPLPEPKGTATEAPEGGSTALAAFEASSKLSSYEIGYLWGGGHSGNELNEVKKGFHGLDCSGSVCWVLHQVGMFPANAAETSTGLEHWGEAGKGKEMTVWTNEAHAFIEFTVPTHERAQLNTNGPQNGPRLYTISSNPSFNAGNPEEETSGGAIKMIARHWRGT